MAAAPSPIMVIVAGSGTGEVVASAPEILGWRRSLNPPGSVNSGAHDRFAVGRHNRQEILAMAESILKYPWKFRQTIGIKRIHRYGGVCRRSPVTPPFVAARSIHESLPNSGC